MNGKLSARLVFLTFGLLGILAFTSNLKAEKSIISSLLMDSQSLVFIETQTGVVFGESYKPLLIKGTGTILLRKKVMPVTHTRTGAGVILTGTGLIVTNAHLVVQAGRITVTLYDNTKLEAHPIKVMPEFDLALIKIDTNHPIRGISFSNSNTVKLDERVFTISSSMLLRNTISEGRITGLGVSKSVTANNPAVIDLIQMNFDIYQGDSGSPLFNSSGELIGIMAAAATHRGKTAYAIPSNKILMAFKEQLMPPQVSAT